VSKQKKITIILLCLIAVLTGLWGAYFITRFTLDSEDRALSVRILPKAYENLVFSSKQNIVVATLDEKEIVINLRGRVIDENEENGKIELLHDDYYRIITESDIILKRNGNEVVRESNITDKYLLHKAEARNAKYVSIYYNNILDASEFDIKIGTYIEETGIISFLYNESTGEIILRDLRVVNGIFIRGNLEMYRVIKNDDSESLISLKDGNEIELPAGISIVSDEIRPNETLPFNIANGTFFIIVNQNRYGLMDREGNIVLEPKYDDLYFSGDNDYHFVAVSNGEFGIINDKGNPVFALVNDGVEIAGNYAVLLRDKRIGVKNLINGEEIYPFEINYNKEYLIRRNNDLRVNLLEDKLAIRTDENTIYLFNEEGLIRSFTNGKNTLVINTSGIIDEFYIVNEEINGNSARISIYCGRENTLDVFENTTSKDISRIGYSLLNSSKLKISFFDDDFNLLAAPIIDPKRGTLIITDLNNRFTEMRKLKEEKFYMKEHGVIKIYNQNYAPVASFIGEELSFISNNTYAVRLNTDKWHLVEIK